MNNLGVQRPWPVQSLSKRLPICGFQIDSGGQLVTNAGYPVQPGITVPANATSFDVSRDGTRKGHFGPRTNRAAHL